MIQRQQWIFGERVLIIDEQYHGSVILDFPKDAKGKANISADAFLYSLWVDKDFRDTGVAKGLMRTVEQIAKEKGVQTISLEWDRREAPLWVFNWYVRLGYEEKELGRTNSLLVKKIV